MKQTWKTILVTQDDGLIAHWQRVLGKGNQSVVHRMEDFFQLNVRQPSMAWIDLSLSERPPWNAAVWQTVLQNDQIRTIAASSNPHDAEAMEALDAGCAAYCHAFSDAVTLRQVREVVDAGHIWIGKALMQRLLRNVTQVVARQPPGDTSWSENLTLREIEVATLAANGASNATISTQCRISERTVKAHLSAVFVKLNITDRLQLALRVHGIH